MKQKIFLLACIVFAMCFSVKAEHVKVGIVQYSIINDSMPHAIVERVDTKDISHSTGLVLQDTVYSEGRGYPVTRIEKNAIHRWYFSSISIPSTITFIEESAFEGSSSIDTIFYIGTLNDWLTKKWDPLLVSKSYYLSINNKIVRSVVIPDTLTSVSPGAFLGCESIVEPVYNSRIFVHCPNSYTGEYSIPEGIEIIADRAFEGCGKLTSVIIPNSIKTIGEKAFRDCWGLSSIDVPETVTTIGSNAFFEVLNINYSKADESNTWGARNSNCYAEDRLVYKDQSKNELIECSPYVEGIVTIPDGVRKIRPYAFSECEDVVAIKVPKSVNDIGEYAFSSAINVEYKGKASGRPWGADHLNYYAEDGILYQNKSKKKIIRCLPYTPETVVIPNSVKNIRKGAFFDCILSTLKIPYIKKGMFKESYIDSLVLQEGIRTIPKEAFAECEVRTVVLPKTLKKVGYDWITRAENVYCYASPFLPHITSWSTDISYYEPKLYVPQDMLLYYKISSYWKNFEIIPLDTIIQEQEMESTRTYGFESIKENEKTGVVSLSGDTILAPVYDCVWYNTDRFLHYVTHKEGGASVFNKYGRCIIPESRGYTYIESENDRKLLAWVCYKEDEDGELYVYAICNWKGEEVFIPKQKYSEVTPCFTRNRLYYVVYDSKLKELKILDAEQQECPVDDEYRPLKTYYTSYLKDGDEVYSIRYSLDNVPKSKNIFPVKNINAVKK